MIELGDLYSDFSRIDLDTRGGYARVSQVKTNGQNGLPEYCAYKLLRHEIDRRSGLERFEHELRLLLSITENKDSPAAITRIYDSGFVSAVLSQTFHTGSTLNSNQKIIPTGKNINEFLEVMSTLEKKEPDQWLPYLVVDLAPYDDSLLRQIRNQPKNDSAGLFRLPTGEAIVLAIQSLDVMAYLHKHYRRAYMDWKPEHIFWNGLSKTIKLIDWNVTIALDEGPGEKQNIRDDIRLFIGAILYTSLTFIDLDDPSKPIGPRPTVDFSSPIPEIRRRYWTEQPEFYQRGLLLDDNIKEIIRHGINPRYGFDNIEELKGTLIEYAKEQLGITQSELTLFSEPTSDYFKALSEVRLAQQNLIRAQKLLLEAIKAQGKKSEFTRVFDVIKNTLKNFPAS